MPARRLDCRGAVFYWYLMLTSRRLQWLAVLVFVTVAGARVALADELETREHPTNTDVTIPVSTWPGTPSDKFPQPGEVIGPESA